MVSKKVYVGIDFGTTHTGFSYTFDGAKNDIFIYSDWPGQQPYSKDKTCILYENENGIWNVKKYGYSAYEHYSRNVATTTNLYFVQRFKLLLDPNSKEVHIKLPTGLTRERLLKDYLGYIKYYVKVALEKKLGDFEKLNISWGITVPAQWTDSAKNEMRKACVACEIIPDLNSDLQICLEPEAAVLCAIVKNPTVFKNGDVVTTVDAGGGTVDYSSFKILDDNQLSELIPSDGCDAGSTFVDDAYLNFVKENIGSDFYLNAINSGVVFSLLHKWEGIKRSFKGTEDEIEDSEYALLELPRALHNNGIYEINIPGTDMVSIFDPTLTLITDLLGEHIGRAKSAPSYPVQDSSQQFKHHLLFVGGFSQSPFAQSRLSNIAKKLDLEILVPSQSDSAIVQGAALFTKNPQLIKERCQKTTYGISVIEDYRESKHSKFKNDCNTFSVNGILQIKDCFKALVKQGQIVEFQDIKSSIYKPIEVGQKNVNLNFYSSSDPETVMINESCSLLGTLSVRIPPMYQNYEPEENEIQVDIQFGKTEIMVKATHLKSKKQCETIINYKEK